MSNVISIDASAQAPFDYNTLPMESALEVHAAASRIKVRLKRTIEDIIEIGKELIAVKNRLGHGQFLPWIKSEFDMNKEMANNFMQVAARFGDKKSDFLTFKLSILYALAAPSTPDEVIDQAVAKAEAGESITAADIKAWKADRIAREEAEKRADEAEDKAVKAKAEAQEIAKDRDVALFQGAFDFGGSRSFKYCLSAVKTRFERVRFSLTAISFRACLISGGNRILTASFFIAIPNSSGTMNDMLTHLRGTQYATSTTHRYIPRPWPLYRIAVNRRHRDARL